MKSTNLANKDALNEIQILSSGSRLLCLLSELGVTDNEMAMVMNAFKGITDPIQASRTMTNEDMNALDDSFEISR